jgi:pimeloyl-ACP methyl ester carboxylesterase
MVAPTVLFIHGTGIREQTFSTAFTQITTELARVRSDLRTERCYWGEIGAELLTGLPAEASTLAAEQAPAGEHGVPEEEKELARWARLFVDPLFEIRLRQVDRPESGGMFDPAVEDLVRALPGQPEVAAALAELGLTGHFVDAVEWVADSAEFGAVFGRVTGSDGDTDDMLSRALVARCLATAAETDGTELAGAARDRLLGAVQAGFGQPDRAPEGMLGRLAKDLAFRAAGPYLRRRQRDYVRLLSDILLYQARGDAIRTFVRTRIRELPEPVVLLAHSLGGIIAFDLLAADRAAELARVRMLVTVGSQVPLLYELGALPSGLSYPSPLPAHFRPPWINVYDQRDLLAFTGGELFGERCRDLRVDTRTPFPTAHGAYWGHEDFYRQLAGIMGEEGL